jgi:antitoxin (DNA-binding transcriptional repressor) of toxin-antitoxin stability system
LLAHDSGATSECVRTVSTRELEQQTSAVLEDVRLGTPVAVTEDGVVIAVIVPPSAAGGIASAIADGRVRPATSSLADVLPVKLRADMATADVLDYLRADRA